MPKYGNFENQPLSRKLLPIDQKYAQFWCRGIERECMSLLLELWPMAKLVVKQSAKAHGPLVKSFDDLRWFSVFNRFTHSCKYTRAVLYG